MSLSALEQSIVKFASSKGDDSLKAAMTSQSVVQLGLSDFPAQGHGDWIGERI